MTNFPHKQLIAAVAQLDVVPDDAEKYVRWIEGDAHLAFLHENARAGEVVVFASGEYTFVHSLVVRNSHLAPLQYSDLLKWSSNPHHGIASYVSGGGRAGVWLERGISGTGTSTLEGATPLLFARTFEGWEGLGRDYVEVNQEYAHVTGIHWRPEKRAYCRFDRLGDLQAVVSITMRADKGSDMTLVSFRWEPLQQYLAATESTLVRLFDFTLLRRGKFNAWPDTSEQVGKQGDSLYYRRKVDPSVAGYTRGFQLVGLREPALKVQNSIIQGWRGEADEPHVEFLAYDWRNRLVRRISTDPAATTNYFVAQDNTLPFELSPAFFRPEVLSKYKTDREKYTLEERDLHCRSAWSLRGIDVNEAGQVHAYICDLRSLPYAEQLHWLSFNEAPKVGISKRAVINDFEGNFVDFEAPLSEVQRLLRRWDCERVGFWQLHDERLMDRVNKPLTSSRDEWAEAFMDLAKLVVEGFSTKRLREELDAISAPYAPEDRTILLLEKVLTKRAATNVRLDGLRTVQSLRSKVKGHVGGSDADDLSDNALSEFETYGNHFDHVCRQVSKDLQQIGAALMSCPAPGP